MILCVTFFDGMRYRDRGATFSFSPVNLQWVCVQPCCHWTWTGVPFSWHMAVNRDTASPFEVLSTCLFICLRVIAAARCGVCGVTARVSSIAIHYSAPLARRSKRAAALPLTGQPGIHESLIILSSLSVSLPFLSFSCHCSVFIPSLFICLFFCLVCHSGLSACHPLSLLLLLLLLLVFFLLTTIPPSRILHCSPNFCFTFKYCNPVFIKSKSAFNPPKKHVNKPFSPLCNYISTVSLSSGCIYFSLSCGCAR